MRWILLDALHLAVVVPVIEKAILRWVLGWHCFLFNASTEHAVCGTPVFSTFETEAFSGE